MKNILLIPAVAIVCNVSAADHMLPKRLQVSGQSTVSFAEAQTKASENIPKNKGFVIQKIELKKIGGVYYCFLTLLKVN